MYTIDIDVGGTLTDGLFGNAEQLASVKVDTTPHDLTVCFLDCLQAGADQLGFDDLGALLAETQLIRWSTTITTNVLAERSGPRLGLFVSEGNEHSLYGQDSSPALGLLGQDSVIGLKQPVDQQAVLTLVKSLLERGVRRVCISLAGAFSDASDEQGMKAVIEQQYPDHFLGAVPALAGSDICKHPDDMTRTHYALINAYVHGPLADTLFKAEDRLRDEYGWKRQLLIGHQNGGVARVAKTRAVDTIESGPTMGLYASAEFARRYGLQHVVALDIGGTTAKVSLISDGTPSLNRAPVVFDIPLKMPAPDVFSIALGGGSVASVDSNSQVQLGPKSMGAYPGPACYDLGGTEATLTDAALLLGYLNPDNFLGGARVLSAEAAREAIQAHVAAPLGASVEAAATQIVNRAADMLAESIKSRLAQAGLAASDCALFAFGGNGGMFATSVAACAGLASAYVFDLGAVFSVLGSSLADIMHVYEHALMVKADKSGTARLNEALIAMRAEAMRDMEGEGLDTAQVQLTLELDTCKPDGAVATKPVALNGALDAKSLKASGVDGQIEMARLRAVYAIGERVATRPAAGGGRTATPTSRSTIWDGSSAEASVCPWDSLAAGDTVAGAAVIEGDNTTYLVAPGWQLQKDEFANGHLTKKGG